MSDTETPEPQEDPCAVPELSVHESEPVCPKCRFAGIRTHWHAFIILGGNYPCEEWFGLPQEEREVQEHLCLRCQRCGYAWATRTADAGPPT